MIYHHYYKYTSTEESDLIHTYLKIRLQPKTILTVRGNGEHTAMTVRGRGGGVANASGWLGPRRGTQRGNTPRGLCMY